MTAKKGEQLQVNQDIDFEQRFWRIERVGWAIMALLIVAALLGLFGSGPISSAKVGKTDNSLMVNYERFGRYKKPFEINVHLGADAITGDQTRLWIDRAYLDRFEVERVMPEPDSVEVEPDRLVYVFNTAGLDKPLSVSFSLQPTSIGVAEGQMGLVDGPSRRFGQFVYP